MPRKMLLSRAPSVAKSDGLRESGRGVLNSRPAGDEIDDDIDRYPAQDHEIPVKAVLAHIDEAPTARPANQDDGEDHGRVGDVGHDMKRVQAHQPPDDRAVGVGVPAYVERGEFE